MDKTIMWGGRGLKVPTVWY